MFKKYLGVLAAICVSGLSFGGAAFAADAPVGSPANPMEITVTADKENLVDVDKFQSGGRDPNGGGDTLDDPRDGELVNPPIVDTTPPEQGDDTVAVDDPCAEEQAKYTAIRSQMLVEGQHWITVYPTGEIKVGDQKDPYRTAYYDRGQVSWLTMQRYFLAKEALEDCREDNS